MQLDVNKIVIDVKDLQNYILNMVGGCEINDKITREKVVNLVHYYFNYEPYDIICDENNNTTDVVDRNEIVIKISR